MRTLARRTLVVPVLVGLALAGAGVSGLLLYGTAGGWDPEPGSVGALLRLCETEPQVAGTCGEIQNSRWGTWALGLGKYQVSVPTSFIGFAYFLALAIWFGMNGQIPAEARWQWRGTLAYLAWGGAGSVAMMGVMGLVLEAWCTLCVIAHAINLAIVAITVACWRSCRRTPAGSVEAGSLVRIPTILRCRIALGSITVSFLLVVLSWLYYDASIAVRRQWRKLSDLRAAVADLQEDAGFVLREFEAQPVVELAIDGGSNASLAGGANARPTLLLFTDPDYAPCRCFEARRRHFIEPALGAGVRTEIRCVSSKSLAGGVANTSELRDGAPLTVASLAVAAAGVQGGEAARQVMQSLLLANRGQRDPESLMAFARRAGLEGERLLTDMKGDVVRERVLDDLTLARRLGVRTVPVAYLSGRRVPDLCLTSDTFWQEFSKHYDGRLDGDVCSPATFHHGEKTVRELAAAVRSKGRN